MGISLPSNGIAQLSSAQNCFPEHGSGYSEYLGDREPLESRPRTVFCLLWEDKLLLTLVKAWSPINPQWSGHSSIRVWVVLSLGVRG